MSEDFEIIGNNGKVYKNLRAYHIAKNFRLLWRIFSKKL